MSTDKLSESEQKFVEDFSDFVNGRLSHYREVGEALANDHRYLIQEKFKVALHFMEKLALDYMRGWYDGRNEYTCKCCYQMIEELRCSDLYFPSEEYRKERGV